MFAYCKSLARFALLAFAGLTVVAVGLALAFPKRPSHWFAERSRYHAVISSAVFPTDRSTLWLDTATGELRREFPVPGGILEQARWSPWKSDRGDSRIAGRLSSWSDNGKSQVWDGGSLAIVNKADGSILRAGDLSFAITGPPCWLPDRPDRLIVPAGNGRLYRFDLPSEEGVGAGTSSGDLTYRAITWACTPPGEGMFHLSDPIVPFVEGLKGRLIVSVRRVVGGDGAYSGPTEIWWLQLDGDHASIVAAGRLTPPSPKRPGEPDLEERYANIGRDANGQLMAAYLVRDFDAREWRMRVARVTSGRDGAPLIEGSSVREVARNCAPTLPAFSTDGRWVYRVECYQEADTITQRFPTDPTLNAPLAVNAGASPDGAEGATD